MSFQQVNARKSITHQLSSAQTRVARPLDLEEQHSRFSCRYSISSDSPGAYHVHNDLR